MMKIDVNSYDSRFNFEIYGTSYIGAPRPNTAMFITNKVGSLITNLNVVNNCLVFAESGVTVPEEVLSNNCFIFTTTPQLEYARFALKFMEMRIEYDRKRHYMLTKEGYYIGENVVVGDNAYIEPGCLIGHDVNIGRNATILSGAVIKNAIIGDNFIANEMTLIGANGFTLTEDEKGNKISIPTLGRVIIGNDVEVGAHDNISCGSGGNTIIEDYVKIDALVHIGHDVHLHNNAEITAGAVVGGFVVAEEHAYIGINATIRNRIKLEANSFIGMGATVTKTVDSGITVAGNPAKPFEKKQ